MYFSDDEKEREAKSRRKVDRGRSRHDPNPSSFSSANTDAGVIGFTTNTTSANTKINKEVICSSIHFEAHKTMAINSIPMAMYWDNSIIWSLFVFVRFQIIE